MVKSLSTCSEPPRNENIWIMIRYTVTTREATEFRNENEVDLCRTDYLDVQIDK